MKKLFIFIWILFFAVSCSGQIPGIGHYQIPMSSTTEECDFDILMSYSQDGIYEYAGGILTELFNTTLFNKEINGTCDGSIMSWGVYDGIYTSTDFGYSWVKKYSATYFSDVSVSKTDGQYMVASRYTGKLYVSSNYGETWVEKSLFWTGGYKKTAINGSGQYMAISQGTKGIYILSNYGSSWATIFSGATVGDIDISNSGEFMVVITGAYTYPGYIYISNDYGVTWAEKTAINKYFRSCAISGTGQYIVAIDDDCYSYYSSDYGNSFSVSTQFGVDDESVYDISMDLSGKNLAITTETGVYCSCDYGATWTFKFTTNNLCYGVFIY